MTHTDSDTGQAVLPDKPTVTIVYCRQCGWLLRAAWMAQEVLSTFSEEVGAVILVPSTGGAFRIEAGGTTIWERVRDGGFPDVATLKRLVRDEISPGRPLGHVDRNTGGSGSQAPNV